MADSIVNVPAADIASTDRQIAHNQWMKWTTLQTELYEAMRDADQRDMLPRDLEILALLEANCVVPDEEADVEGHKACAGGRDAAQASAGGRSAGEQS